MRPVTLRNQNLNKGPSSSAEFNQLRNDMHTDITTMFNIINEHDARIADNMDHIVRENYFLQNRIEKLLNEVSDLKRAALTNTTTNENVMTRSFFHAANIDAQSADAPVEIDTLHGVVSPVVVRSSDKIAFRNDFGEHLLPSDLEILVLESHDAEAIDPETGERTYYSVDDSEITKAFDGDKNTFWVRHAEFNESQSITEVYGIISVVLPQNLTNNVFTNTIILHPSPEHSMSITDIQYKNMNDEWRRLENYPVRMEDGVEVPVEIEESGKLIFSFPRKEIVEIQIKVKQPYWFNHDNRRIFMYGFQDIIVEQREYSQDAAEFMTRFSLEGTGRRFASVDMPIVKTPVGTPPFNDYTVRHELYFDSGLTEQFEFSTDIFQQVETVFVKTILQSAGDSIPIIREIELPYTHEDITVW